MLLIRIHALATAHDLSDSRFPDWTVLVVSFPDCSLRVILEPHYGLELALASSSTSESDSLPVSSAVQTTKVLREPMKTTEK